MRFWLALTLFVGGLVAGSIGLVNQLQNQPISAITASERLEVATTYLFVPSSVLSSYDAPVEVSVRGVQIFVAEARDVDILGWLGDSPHVELRLAVNSIAETASLIELTRSGPGGLTDPAGSDVWRVQHRGSGVLEFEPPRDGETGLLIAATGIDMAPRQVALTWDLPDGQAPIAPITLVGIGLMSSGSAFGVWAAIDSARRQRSRRSSVGPRRPRRRPPRRVVSQAGPSPKRGRRAAPMAFVASLLTLGTLTGCVAEYENPIISPSPLPSPEFITAAVTRDQAERILQEIVSVVADSDENLDRETLEVRVSGPALDMRRFSYNVARRFTEEERRPEPILASPIQLFLPPATDTWPRTMLLVTGEENPQLLVIRQESARESFKLYQYMSLLPGVDFPEVAAETVGANQLREDSRFLKASPLILAEATGDLLNNGSASTWVDLIDPENPYIQDLSAVQRALAETLSNANLSFSHELESDPVTLLATVDGGALAGIYMIDTYTIIPRDPGDAVAISGDEAVLLGSAGSATGIETRYGAMLLFHIPAAGSDQRITLLGATQQLLTAVALGAQ